MYQRNHLFEQWKESEGNFITHLLDLLSNPIIIDKNAYFVTPCFMDCAYILLTNISFTKSLLRKI